MTPPIFFVDRSELQVPAGRSLSAITVKGEQGRHAVTVRRIKLGEQVLIGDGMGTVLSGVVSDISGKDRFAVAIAAHRRDPVPDPQVTVVQALIKGERLERAIESMTEVGADQIVPWMATNCVVRWKSQQSEGSVNKLRRRALEASRQARRSHVCEVAELATTDDLVAVASGFDKLIILHESASTPINRVDLPDTGRIAIVVGPEGGLTQAELDRLAAAGGRFVRLGPTVMRAGTAGTAALGWVLGATGRWTMPDSRT